jgi:hypothetical protein
LNLLKYFQKQTHYPQQVIPEKAKTLILELEQFLIENKTSLDNTGLSVLDLQVPLADQLKSTTSMLIWFKNKMIAEYDYIPRSIAYTIDQDGTWHFYIGVRREYQMNDEVKNNMWVDLLIRTNNAL